MKKYRFIVAIVGTMFFSLAVHGQITFVGPDVAMERLEVKAQEVEELISAGEIKGVEAEIHQMVFKIMSNDLRNNNPVDATIEAAFEKCGEAFVDAIKEVDDIKNLIIDLLRE